HRHREIRHIPRHRRARPHVQGGIVNSVEDRVHAAMSAAAELAAREIRAAPPLRLPSEPAAGARRGHAPRRWIRWAAPLAAAAVVPALARASGQHKDSQTARGVPPTPAAPAGPHGVPRYYVALKQFAGKAGNVTEQNGIVVGDSLTGKTLATFAPPARTTF